jgi:hypothetical protein
MEFTVKVRERDGVMERRAGESIGAAIRAYPRWFEVEADYAQEAAEMARTQLAADETIDELWVSNPNGGADVFDRQADFLRHEETMPLRGHDR